MKETFCVCLSMGSRLKKKNKKLPPMRNRPNSDLGFKFTLLLKPPNYNLTKSNKSCPYWKHRGQLTNKIYPEGNNFLIISTDIFYK